MLPPPHTRKIFHNSRNIISAAEQCEQLSPSPTPPLSISGRALGLSFACHTKYILIKRLCAFLAVFSFFSRSRFLSSVEGVPARAPSLCRPPRPPPVVLLPLETPLWRAQRPPFTLSPSPFLWQTLHLKLKLTLFMCKCRNKDISLN